MAPAPATPRALFVNLPVEDLQRSVDFFTKLRFEFDPRFTDETATCMVVSDQGLVMLLRADRFRDFTDKELADTAQSTEVILGVSAGSREEVDELVEKALAAGGTLAGEAQDHGFMYSRAFDDPDGHRWELVWMDPAVLES